MFQQTSVRYIKNGEGGCWWAVAKRESQLHAGWSNVGPEILSGSDLEAMREAIRRDYEAKGMTRVTQSFNMLKALRDRPSQHVWITFADGCMWWTLVNDGLTINPEGESAARGNFWLTCATPWSNKSLLGGLLNTGNLPGNVTATAGYQSTVCTPSAEAAILRIIKGVPDEDVAAADKLRIKYEEAIGVLISRLHPQDFEQLVDLILIRSGWSRISELGKITEGIDIEAENIAANEVAFVQVKSRADNAVFQDYLNRFQSRRDAYQRMIFAVHKSLNDIVEPEGEPVQVWNQTKLSKLVVRHGLGEWVFHKVA